MFHAKAIVPKSIRQVLDTPVTISTHEPKQRRLMAVALVLLVIALGFILYRDRDFWFPDTSEADDQLQPVPMIAAAPVTTPVVPAATPAPTAKAASPASKPAAATVATKSRAPKAVSKSPTKLQAKAVAPASVSNAATSATTAVPTTTKSVAPTSPVTAPVPATATATPLPAGPNATATATRTVLPPLEVEVVAGDNHSTVRPGSNSVHVELKPGAATKPAIDPVVAAAPAVNPPATAASVTSSAAERVQMSTGTANVVTHSVNPNYPTLARQMKVQGSVILQALIGRDGTIQSLQVVSGPAILASAAQDAVKQWRFRPHYQGEEAVETQARITVNFTISTN